MSLRRLACTLLPALLLAAPVWAQTSLNPLLRASAAEHRLPAMAAAVIKNGKVIALGAVGTRKLGADIPVLENDRFHIGSDTKAMTALLAAIAVEQGKLRWDSTMGDVFPELAAGMDARLQKATLEQLLAHTSGVATDGDALWELIGKAQFEEGNLNDLRYWLIKQVAARPQMMQAPGTFAYSNLGYTMAAAMLERVSGKTWEELIVERLFQPLGMRSAGIGPQSTLGRIDAPLGHAEVSGKLTALLAGSNGDVPPIIAPAGGAHMSIRDFARWAGWNAGLGKRGPALVTPAGLRRLHTPLIAMPANPDQSPNAPFDSKYALGWVLTHVKWAPRPLLHHGGSNSRNLAHIWVDPERDMALVLVANIAQPSTAAALLGVAAQLYRRYEK